MYYNNKDKSEPFRYVKFDEFIWISFIFSVNPSKHLSYFTLDDRKYI